jgi:hypothetical protein
MPKRKEPGPAGTGRAPKKRNLPQISTVTVAPGGGSVKGNVAEKAVQADFLDQGWDVVWGHSGERRQRAGRGTRRFGVRDLKPRAVAPRNAKRFCFMFGMNGALRPGSKSSESFGDASRGEASKGKFCPPFKTFTGSKFEGGGKLIGHLRGCLIRSSSCEALCTDKGGANGYV